MKQRCYGLIVKHNEEHNCACYRGKCELKEFCVLGSALFLFILDYCVPPFIHQ